MLQSTTAYIIKYNYIGKFPKLMRIWNHSILQQFTNGESRGIMGVTMYILHNGKSIPSMCRALLALWDMKTSIPIRESKDRNYQSILNPWWTILTLSKCVFKFHWDSSLELLKEKERDLLFEESISFGDKSGLSGYYHCHQRWWAENKSNC